MKTIQQQYGIEIWKKILQAVVDHSETEVDTKTLVPSMRTDALFSPKTTEGRNRFGNVLFDLFDEVNHLCQTDFGVDYPPRSEFYTFPDLQSIWLYFIHRLEEEPSLPGRTPSSDSSEKNKKKGEIIPFPLKKQ